MKRLLTLISILLAFNISQAQLVQHLTADVEESILKDSTNLVSVWQDQSGEVNNATASLGKVYYSKNETDENAWLDFGDSVNSLELFSAEASDTWLDQSSGTGGFCILLAFKVNSRNTNWNDIIGNSTSVASGFGLRFSESGTIQGYLGKAINKSGKPVEAGDKIVYAFNYNAATGSYEFWDSKNGSSVSGTRASQDFSLSRGVSLGATEGGPRSFNGMVGEVKAYNNVLSNANFVAEREAMMQKWVGVEIEIPLAVNWRIISEDLNYPTEDAILAAITVSDEGFNSPLPADQANNDCTPTFQEAINLVDSEGGGTVFIPEGIYRLDGRLVVPANVTLRGRWRPLSETDPAIGTIIKIYDGHGNASGNPFISLSGSGGIRDLTFWHPEQNPENIVAYPFVIQSSGGPITIENITLVNAYKGVDMSSASMCFIDNIQGTALNTGFFADKSYAVSRFDKLNFGPVFWKWAKLGDAPGDAYESYMMSNGLGIDIREMDGFHMTEPKVRGMNIGLRFDVGVTGDNPHGDMSGIDIKDCNVAMQVNSAKGISIVNSHFEGIQSGILNLYACALKVNNCTFVGGTTSIQNTDGGTLKASSCVFDGKVISSGNVKITSSDFISTGTDIELIASTKSALIYGCTFADGEDIINNSSVNAIIKNDVEDSRYTPSPILPLKDLSIVRKPAKTDLFNIVDYGAVANDNGDDSNAFAQAIEAANANNGGVVFIPNGKFDLSGSYTLTKGVELRGVSGSRHKSQQGEEHSLVQITGNEGNPNGEPFITLEEGSGIRGLSFYYPSQKASMIVPETLLKYPFTVRGAGDDVWITDCMFSNPYQAINFVNADNHLLENCFLGGLVKTLYIQNCDGGRVENFHLKPDFWRDLKMGEYPATGTGTSQLKRFCGKYLHGIWLENSTNQVVYNIFNHASHQFFRADNSTGIGFMIGGEQLQRGYRFSGNSDISLVIPVANMNNQGDDTGCYGIWSDENFTGTVNSWLGSVEGTADQTFYIQSGEILTQQNYIGGPGDRGVVNMKVAENATLDLNAFSFSRMLALDFAEGSKVSIRESSFGEMPNVLFYDTNTVLERNTFTSSYIVMDANQDPIANQGFLLEDENIKMENSPMFGTDQYDARMIKGARSSVNEFVIHATDKDFMKGSNSPLSMKTYFYVDTNCKIEVFYNSISGRKLGKSESYSGGSSPGYKKLDFTASDAMFTGEEDVYIKITGESPLLNYVVASRNISAFNLAPVWSADTIYYADAKAGKAYDAAILIGTDIVDPENDNILFSKVSGPTWLSISSTGQLSGTPGDTNIGLNSFIVQANDGHGNKINTTLIIDVKKDTGASLVGINKLSIYPNPVKNRLHIRGLDIVDYAVFDVLGNRIINGKTHENSIDVSTLQQGGYVLKVNGLAYSFIKM